MTHELEMWAGVECTVNRVGVDFFDQLKRNGHHARIDDLDAFASLGVRKLRYPILWERTAPHGECDFQWADARMRRLGELGMDPIVGLVHHGSGPASTNLLDPEFPRKLAGYAGEVVRRYPHILDWTPVNEPLTTARFSGLYGLWYPHARDGRSFLRALVHQCRGVVLAMQAIRAVQPAARLVQTEDLGRVFSTPKLVYQAAYENERRWLSLDLLVGRVDRHHALWGELIDAGIDERELLSFQDTDVRPEVIGINYYVTSDRYLDERLERFPAHTHGGNGRERYADVEAVRVLPRGIVGHERVLLETWSRFGAPLAITEAHLGCTREEQVRWLVEAWNGAAAARAAGADVRAVTVWSLLGAHDWNTLLVRSDGNYESGAFDIRAEVPRATAVAQATRALATEGHFDHPLLDAPGWWRRPERIIHSVPGMGAPSTAVRSERGDKAHRGDEKRVILITGGGGGLARALTHASVVRALYHRTLSRAELDVADADAVIRALDRIRPWAVVNAAGFVRMPGAPAEETRFFRENALGAAVLARACGERGIRFVTFSSDHVFDGQKGEAYHERDLHSPITPYGRSKARAEHNVLTLHEDALIIRAGMIFGPSARKDVVRETVQRLMGGHVVEVEQDVVFSPTYAPDLANAALDLLIDGDRGVWNVANVGEMSALALLRESARIAKLDPRRIVARVAEPSRNRVLTSERGALLPSAGDALDRYFREHGFGELARSVA